MEILDFHSKEFEVIDYAVGFLPERLAAVKIPMAAPRANPTQISK